MKRSRRPTKAPEGFLFSLLAAALLVFGCSPLPSCPQPFQQPEDPIASLLGPGLSEPEPALERMGYSIQVGAFGVIENAVRLERQLETQGIDAYYFRHETGLYKVRFGNHPDYQQAREEAERLQSQGLIGEFFIVAPDEYAAARMSGRDREELRVELVRTARRFLGVPYRWGGTDSENGFDCSGLAMVCYRLNGLNLPRVSRNQYQAGRRVSRDELRRGDLVFFATGSGRRITHVGIYIGDDRFIHAPRTGEKVRVEELSSPFYTRTFVGARSYL